MFRKCLICLCLIVIVGNVGEFVLLWCNNVENLGVCILLIVFDFGDEDVIYWIVLGDVDEELLFDFLLFFFKCVFEGCFVEDIILINWLLIVVVEFDNGGVGIDGGILMLFLLDFRVLMYWVCFVGCVLFWLCVWGLVMVRSLLCCCFLGEMLLLIRVFLEELFCCWWVFGEGGRDEGGVGGCFIMMFMFSDGNCE